MDERDYKAMNEKKASGTVPRKWVEIKMDEAKEQLKRDLAILDKDPGPISKTFGGIYPYIIKPKINMNQTELTVYLSTTKALTPEAGDIVKRLRQDVNIDRFNMAKQLGMSITHYANFERGRVGLSAEVMNKLAEILNIKLIIK
jgi:DNA-binding XRE family transcriptional regulator